MATSKKSANEFSSRESSFDPPIYSISHAKDHTLQWDPPVGSKDLAIALSYHFPMETSMENKMRAATKKFLKEEKRKRGRDEVQKKALATVLENTELIAPVRGTDVDGPPSGETIESNESVKAHTEIVPCLDKIVPRLMEDCISLKSPSKEVSPADEDPSTGGSVVVDPSTGEKSTGGQQLDPKMVLFYDEASGNLVFKNCITTTEAPIPSTSMPIKVIPPSKCLAAPQRLSWVNGLDPIEPKRTKRRYGVAEAAKVAANRGNACEEHKKRKVKCNPDSCPNNGILKKKSSKTVGEGFLNRIFRRPTPDIRQRSIPGTASNNTLSVSPAVDAMSVSQLSSSKQMEISDLKTNPVHFNVAGNAINNETMVMTVPEPVFLPNINADAFDFCNDVLDIEPHYATYPLYPDLHATNLWGASYEDGFEMPLMSADPASCIEAPSSPPWELYPKSWAIDLSSFSPPTETPDLGYARSDRNKSYRSNYTLSSGFHHKTKYFHHDTYNSNRSLVSEEQQGRRKGFALREASTSSKPQLGPISDLRSAAATTSRRFRELLQGHKKDSGGEVSTETSDAASGITESSITYQQCDWTYYGGPPGEEKLETSGELAPPPFNYMNPSLSNIQLAKTSNVFESPEMMDELNAISGLSDSRVIRF
ncbi:hypothetical protein VTL71DRAFT_14932 [Oculimacula yallundae]|uniref:Uncharacterized protein n=1 Tax=Oculimacula yallundae TaxID=86028 RepID=A0ABR4CF62_9HELO